MKALIGISCDICTDNGLLTLRQQYIDAVLRAGGTPVVLPPSMCPSHAGRCLEICQGLLLTGGGDVDPAYWGEPPSPALGYVSPVRDYFEITLTKKALAADMPILGICRGMQVINVAGGGTLCQDLQTGMSHQQNAPRSQLFHDILINVESKLGQIYKTSPVGVNSFHHQAVARVAQGFKPTAASRDGTIEAMEREIVGFVLGVQWHPEDLDDNCSRALFREFVACAQSAAINIQ